MSRLSKWLKANEDTIIPTLVLIYLFVIPILFAVVMIIVSKNGFDVNTKTDLILSIIAIYIIFGVLALIIFGIVVFMGSFSRDKERMLVKAKENKNEVILLAFNYKNFKTEKKLLKEIHYHSDKRYKIYHQEGITLVNLEDLTLKEINEYESVGMEIVNVGYEGINKNQNIEKFFGHYDRSEIEDFFERGIDIING